MLEVVVIIPVPEYPEELEIDYFVALIPQDIFFSLELKKKCLIIWI
jgi:hypothetical protein